MYKELDKVEKKLITGVGSAEDRANRAKLDLNRAQKYMDEIEKQYTESYNSDNQMITAAKNRLSAVHGSWEAAMTSASGQDTAAEPAIAQKTEPQEQESVAAAPAPKSTVTVAKLPGGVTSRINKMNKELDKVEKKIAKEEGTPADRAKRAKLDLNRAEN